MLNLPGVDKGVLVPTIPGYPQALLDQHHHWHTPSAHPEVGGGRTFPMGTPGAGLEFLTFHRNFISQFFSWYSSTTFPDPPFSDPAQKAGLVAGWTAVPDELKQPSLGWNAAWAASEDRLSTGTPDFTTADELGTFIEVGIHNNFLHGASAAHFNEPALGGFHSPQSSVFYKIHGLVDHWWSQWQMRHKLRIKELVKELVDEVRKPIRREVFKDPVPEVKVRIDEVKGLVAREAPDVPQPLDPVTMDVLNLRLARIEREVFQRGHTFITGVERAHVREDVEPGETEHRHG